MENQPAFLWKNNKYIPGMKGVQMTKLIDLSGKKFGRLTVIERAENNNHNQARWKCLCDCGNTKTINSRHLRSGETRSCGCLPTGRKPITGDTDSRLYVCWYHMVRRVQSDYIEAHRYYDRGIGVVDEWLKWENFRDWANLNGYDEKLTIDRIDNDKGYSPENCRWVDAKTQARNRSTNRRLTIEGETKTLIEWCEELDLNYGTILARLDRGWSDEKALFTPVRLIKKNRRVN